MNSLFKSILIFQVIYWSLVCALAIYLKPSLYDFCIAYNKQKTDNVEKCQITVVNIEELDLRLKNGELSFYFNNGDKYEKRYKKICLISTIKNPSSKYVYNRYGNCEPEEVDCVLKNNRLFKVDIKIALGPETVNCDTADVYSPAIFPSIFLMVALMFPLLMFFDMSSTKIAGYP